MFTLCENNWISLVLALPLLGAVLSYLVGRLTTRGADGQSVYTPLPGILASGFALATFFFSLLSIGWPSSLTAASCSVGEWFSLTNYQVDFGFRVDSLAGLMILMITGIGTLIHVYSIGYMSEDEHQGRFFGLLNLFLFFMLVLVAARNLVVLFVGWEGVGLCSYLLIGFWFRKAEYAKAARKAFIVNRIGDAAFLVAIFILFALFQTLDLDLLAGKLIALKGGALGIETAWWLSIAGGLLFLACSAKSAQLPLFTWLPDAMAGPTPVSALIHAATMVTAGLYLFARLEMLWPWLGGLRVICLVLAVLTAVVGALSALAQRDIKKVLAYSTVSQLGFMMTAAVLGAHQAALFHVLTHAFFKAALFLGAGSVIHGCHGEQDLKRLGGLVRHLPITCFTYGVSVLAISGVFPLAGFYSKHAILAAVGERAAHNPEQGWGGDANQQFWSWMADWGGSMVTMVLTLTAILTAFYMVRSFLLAFGGSYRGEDDGHGKPHEAGLAMQLPVLILTVGAVVGGWLFEGEVQAIFSNSTAQHHPSFGWGAAIIDSWPGLLGIGIGVVVFVVGGVKVLLFDTLLLARLTNFSRSALWIDEVYDLSIVGPFRAASKMFALRLESGLVFGVVNSVWIAVVAFGEVVAKCQAGRIGAYLFQILFSLSVLLLFFILL